MDWNKYLFTVKTWKAQTRQKRKLAQYHTLLKNYLIHSHEPSMKETQRQS
jgi:hypothetical protein